MTEYRDTEISFFRHKRKDALMVLIGWALLSGVFEVLAYFSQWALFLSFVVHLDVQMGATFLWCKNDARMRGYVMPPDMKEFIITGAIIGVPWYFVGTRGWMGGAKRCFGLPLILISSVVYFGAWAGARSIAALMGYFE